MLSIPELSEKISKAYDHAKHNRVEEFQKLDDEIAAIIPHYVNQITYSSTAVINLNKLQLSNIFTQCTKIIGVMILIALSIIGVSYVPFFDGAATTILGAAVIGGGLIYIWKKIPKMRQLWKDNATIDIHGLNLHNGLAQSIIALDVIKAFHQNTVLKVQEWEKQGLLKQSEELPELPSEDLSLEKVLKSLKDRSHYEHENDENSEK